MIDESREQCLLVGEVIVDERLAHAGSARDVAQRHRRGTGRRDLVSRRVHDPLGRGAISIFGMQRLLLAAARSRENDR